MLTKYFAVVLLSGWKEKTSIEFYWKNRNKKERKEKRACFFPCVCKVKYVDCVWIDILWRIVSVFILHVEKVLFLVIWAKALKST